MSIHELFLALLAVTAFVAGAIAAVCGFGIGSLLTPILSLEISTRLAVAAVSIPHLMATGLRLWLLRRDVDLRLLWNFGVMSAVGGLLGALLQGVLRGQALTLVLAGLLIFAGLMRLLGFSERLKFTGWKAWVAGTLSGVLGGLVGNQGGIRSAAMLGMGVPRTAFVATATAAGLIVDLARMPVYVWSMGAELLPLWPEIAIAIAGTIVGTLAGARLLRRIPDAVFQRLVAVLLMLLGVSLLVRLN